MRKWTPDMKEAYARKTKRELAARGITLKPDVVVGKIEPSVIVKKVDKDKLKKYIDKIEDVIGKPKKKGKKNDRLYNR